MRSISDLQPSNFPGESTWRLVSGIYFCYHYLRVFGTGIAQCPQDMSLSKASPVELSQKGHAFLGPGNSGKPVGFTLLNLGGERFAQDNFGGINRATRPHYTGQFTENALAGRIQVKDAIDKRHVNRGLSQA